MGHSQVLLSFPLLAPTLHAGDVGVGQVRPSIDHVVFLSAIRFSWFIVRLLSSAPESLADRSGISLSERNQADGLIRIGG